MNSADQYRKVLIQELLTEGVAKNNRLKLEVSGNQAFYNEIITLEEIEKATEGFSLHKNLESFLNEFVHERLNPIVHDFGYMVNESLVDVNTTDLYDGYEVHVPLKKRPYDSVEELFTEIDGDLEQQPNNMPPPVKANPALNNHASNTPITKEPHQMKNLPNAAKRQKTQNPKKVDLILKSVFEAKFNSHELKSDVGGWKVAKNLNKNGKLCIVFENVDHDNIMIEVLMFPEDTNKVMVEVKNRGGQLLLETFFEIYRIPTDDFLAEKFFRKTLFVLLKKYIDTNVVQIDPFKFEFIFWKTDNPSFSYSFSTPNKNKIILDLISFISTAKKPILDDFFEQNNLKHKQGYLQTLLDSAEAAGIFKFKREGNEILILRGPNYKPFLEGKVRRVVA